VRGHLFITAPSTCPGAAPFCLPRRHWKVVFKPVPPFADWWMSLVKYFLLFPFCLYVSGGAELKGRKFLESRPREKGKVLPPLCKDSPGLLGPTERSVYPKVWGIFKYFPPLRRSTSPPLLLFWGWSSPWHSTPPPSAEATQAFFFPSVGFFVNFPPRLPPPTTWERTKARSIFLVFPFPLNFLLATNPFHDKNVGWSRPRMVCGRMDLFLRLNECISAIPPVFPPPFPPPPRLVQTPIGPPQNRQRCTSHPQSTTPQTQTIPPHPLPALIF